jgi:SAM-dependent methyltransferase
MNKEQTDRVLSMSCAVCGGNKFEDRPVLWPLLIAEWGLSLDEAAYVERQQGRTCTRCGANLRIIALARAMASEWGAGPILTDFPASERASHLRILEINGAEGITELLRKMPQHRLINYPEHDMQALGFDDGVFDAVVHSDTLEHVPDPRAGLRECRRLLAPGGALFFTVPIIVGRLTRNRDGLPPSYHGNVAESGEDFRVQTEFGADVWRLVMEAGFSEVTLTAVEYPAAIAITARP